LLQTPGGDVAKLRRSLGDGDRARNYGPPACAQKSQRRFNKLPRRYAMMLLTVIRQSTCPIRFKK
jgi:hypothetical protein